MEVLSQESLDWALTHIERYGDTDFFPVPFEYEAIRHSWGRVRSELLSRDIEKYQPQSPRRVVVPKSRNDFRIAAQLDPLDCIVYMAMVFEMAPAIESSRVAADQFVACAYRINTLADGSLFEAESGWPQFHEQSRTLANLADYSHVLLADITDFYNQASHHRIENSLEVAGVPSPRAKAMEKFLLVLSAKQSRGLPVGPSGSIVLAEACLNDVDTFLLRRGKRHTRFVDDFRIFCRSQAEAVQTQHDLCDYLYTAHRLTFNSSKTYILSTKEFLERELVDPKEEEEKGRVNLIKSMLAEFIENVGGYEAFMEIDDFQPLLDTDEKLRLVQGNLTQLFEDALQRPRLHLGTLRYLLRRAAALRTNVIHSLVVNNLSKLSPVLRDVGIYLKSTKAASKSRGAELVEFLESDDFGVLPFSRLWGLDIINEVDGIVPPQKAMSIAESSPSDIAERSQAFIAIKARYLDWVRERKEKWSNYGAWERRALILASKALPLDERNPWLELVKERGDSLDKAVAEFVRGTA